MEYKAPTEIIRRVGMYLQTPMPLDEKRLTQELVALDGCRYDLAEKSAKWHRLVAEARRRYLHPKDKDLTELDRTTMLDANIGEVRQDYEFLCKLEELVRDRIELGKLLLTRL